MKKYFNNFIITLGANIINILVNIAVTFILPKELGEVSYGYFQLYLFYANYIGFLHFGWADGIYLRYGGEYYENINKPVFSGQFWLYSFFEILAGVLCFVGIYIFYPSNDKAIVLQMTGLSVCFILPRTLLQYILQCTGRIKENAIVILSERILYLGLLGFTLFNGFSNFVFVLYCDLISKAVSLLYAIYKCRDMIFVKPVSLKSILKEMVNNLSVGSKLMFSNISSMLIIGIVRLAIEGQWGVVVFGKISLTMSVSNLFMVLINAVALVIFPVLKHLEDDKLSRVYTVFRTILMVIMLGLLILYSPFKFILSKWLPQYAEGLRYMAILFPICLFESKMSLLLSTYMKALRKERELLQINAFVMVLSIIMTLINIRWLHNLNLMVLSIVILLGIRSILVEKITSKLLNLELKRKNVEEILLVIVFIFSSWYVGGTKGLIIYLLAYILYMFLNQIEIINVFTVLKDVGRRTR